MTERPAVGPQPGAGAPADPGRRLLRMGAALAAVSLANRVASYGREAVLAYFLGATAAADQYAVAYAVASVLGLVLGTAFGVVLVPQLVQREAADDRAGMRLLVARTSGAVLLVSVAAAAAMAALEPPAWRALGPAGRLNWWGFAAGLPLVALFTLYGFVLNARDRFVAPLALPILLDAVVVAGYAGAADRVGIGALGLSFAAGSLALAAVVAAQAARLGAFAPPALHGWRTAPWLLVLPALLISAAPALLPLLARALAISLTPGDAAVLHYAFLVAAVPVGLLAQPASMLLLPYLSRAAIGRADLFRQGAAGGLTAVLVLALPAAAGLAVLAQPIVSLLFGRGALNPEAVGRVARALVAFAPGLIGLTAFSVVQQGWYARQRTWVPLSVSLLGLAAGAGAGALLRPALGYVGLALGVSAGNLVAGGTLVGLLRRRAGGGLDRAMSRLLARSAAAAAVMAAAVGLWRGAAGARPDAVVVTVGIALGVAVYGLVLLGPEWLRLHAARRG